MSKIIVIEGPDRCGKATQSRLLCDYLNSRSIKAKVVEVPIQDPLTYQLIYWSLSNGLAKKNPKVFQLLQCLNRWLFQSFKLPSLEHEYDYIIFDRWSLSTNVYGQATGLSKTFVDPLYRILRKPDFTILILGPAHKHSAEDVYESDDLLQENVREIYSKWAAGHPHDCHVVDSRQSKEAASCEIIKILRTTRHIPA